MFTGIIEEIGKVKKIISFSGGKKIEISAKKITDDMKIDDSVCVSGVCLTVIAFDSTYFAVEAVGETIEKTLIDKLTLNSSVNLERALKLNDRLGGHIVQGHVNGIGRLTDIKKRGKNYYIEIEFPQELDKYFISEGSVAVEGISLTIAKLYSTSLGISVIPHTWVNTNLSLKSIGDYVNLEVDLIAKYIEKLLTVQKNGNLTLNKMKELGY